MDIYELYRYVSRPIRIQHNIGPSYPNPLHVYITRVNSDNSIDVICRNAAGFLHETTFQSNTIISYLCA
ncbi:hypothetical protein [Bacillus sp. GM_Baccil_2]|uniref:hypothetical protein n=1 Tax=Bacillus sp. GM_Baccil_2 TaxID=2937369 RepID=UPI00226A0F09|nr:hypothetical protein [Bacillus cereus]